jgi:hypothetical protein
LISVTSSALYPIVIVNGLRNSVMLPPVSVCSLMSNTSPTRRKFSDDGGAVASCTTSVAFSLMAPGGMWMAVSSEPSVADKLPPSSALTGAVDIAEVGIGEGIAEVGVGVGCKFADPPPTTGR